MTAWSKIRWSEAGQVLEMLGLPADEMPAEATLPPEQYYVGLRKAGRRSEAADFLAGALPRLEAVAWAARTVRDVHPPAPNTKPAARALRAALFYVQDPTDTRRRAAFEAAEACVPRGPEAMAAYAAFFSAGSLGPPGQQPVPAPKDASGRLAAAAVKSATFGVDRTGAALDRALDAGEQLAREGLRT